MIKKALFKHKEVKMTKFTVFAIRCALILLLCAITLFFALWVPTLHEEICELLHAQAEKLYMLHNLVFPLASIISLSAIGVVGIAFEFPSAISRDEIFSAQTAKRLMIIAVLIFIGCAVGIISASLLIFIGERLLAPVLFLAFLIGAALGFMLAVLSAYVKRAAALKEEVDHTL